MEHLGAAQVEDGNWADVMLLKARAKVQSSLVTKSAEGFDPHRSETEI